MESSSTALQILNVVSQYSVYISYVIFFGGVFGNALNILVFTYLKLFRRNRCALYFTVESILNIVYVSVTFITGTLTIIYGNDQSGSSLLWCRSRFILFQTCTLTSFSIACFVACDQFFSTSHRFYLREICTIKLARCLTVVAFCLWLLHSILFGLFLNIESSLVCAIANPIWTSYSTFFFYPVLYGPLPIFMASLFSVLAFHNVRHIIRRQVPIVRRRLDRQMTAMVLIRVVFLALLSLPYAIYRIYAINVTTTSANLLQYAIVRLIQVIVTSFNSLNFAGSFYIFMASSPRYRRQVKYVLVKKCWRQWKRCCRVNENQVNPVIIASTSSNIELE